MVLNDESRVIVWHAAKTSTLKTEGAQFYREYTHNDEGFWAILGSPNGASTLRMMANHKHELGGRTVEKIIVSERDDIKKLETPNSRTFVVLLTERRLAESGDAGHSIPNVKLPQPNPGWRSAY